MKKQIWSFNSSRLDPTWNRIIENIKYTGTAMLMFAVTLPWAFLSQPGRIPYHSLKYFHSLNLSFGLNILLCNLCYLPPKCNHLPPYFHDYRKSFHHSLQRMSFLPNMLKAPYYWPYYTGVIITFLIYLSLTKTTNPLIFKSCYSSPDSQRLTQGLYMLLVSRIICIKWNTISFLDLI